MSLPKPCKQHDFPEGARYCIQCGAEVIQAATGRTERLSIEARALFGDGDLYVTREEYFELQKNYRAIVAWLPWQDEPHSVMCFLGRNIVVQD